MSHQKIDYVDIMRSNGLRVTSQRLLILDAICEGHGHTTVGQIFARVRQKDRSIDRSTVYRTLDVFVELGLIVSADTGIGEKVYEIAKPEPHHHLVCKNCGKEREIDNTVMQRLFGVIEEEYRFAINMDHVVLFGLCQACQKDIAALSRKRET
jgi:Fur family ferric uptake transcriptional regulator